MTDPARIRQAWKALGQQLATYRRAAGFTQHALAPLAHYGRSTIANAETGHQHPDRAFWLRCDELLHAGGQLVAGYEQIIAIEREYRRPAPVEERALRGGMPRDLPQRFPYELGRTSAWPPVPAPRGWETLDDIAGIVTGDDGAYVGLERAITLAAARTSAHAMNAGAWAVSETTIEQLRDDAARIARTFSELSPVQAVSETLQLRQLAMSALDQTRRPAQQHELYLITGQVVALLASASCDLGLWTSAMQYARAADTYGEIIGHTGVRAYARGIQAIVAYWNGDSGEAVGHAQVAAELAPAGLARVRALCVLARSWAHRGGAVEVRQALASADDARADDGHDELHDVTGGEFGFAEAQQARCASTAWLQVGYPEEATSAATAALRLAMRTGVPWSTVEAEARVDLATCQLLSGRLDAAQDTLSRLWSMPPDWRRSGLFGRLRRVQGVLASDNWRQNRQAQDIAILANDFAATRPEPPALPSE